MSKFQELISSKITALLLLPVSCWTLTIGYLEAFGIPETPGLAESVFFVSKVFANSNKLEQNPIPLFIFIAIIVLFSQIVRTNLFREYLKSISRFPERDDWCRIVNFTFQWAIRVLFLCVFIWAPNRFVSIFGLQFQNAILILIFLPSITILVLDWLICNLILTNSYLLLATVALLFQMVSIFNLAKTKSPVESVFPNIRVNNEQILEDPVKLIWRNEHFTYLIKCGTADKSIYGVQNGNTKNVSYVRTDIGSIYSGVCG